MGRLLGVGSGGECFVHALADGDSLLALGDGTGEARYATGLEPEPDHLDLPPDDPGDLLDAKWDSRLGSRLRRGGDRVLLPRIHCSRPRLLPSDPCWSEFGAEVRWSTR